MSVLKTKSSYVPRKAILGSTSTILPTCLDTTLLRLQSLAILRKDRSFLHTAQAFTIIHKC